MTLYQIQGARGIENLAGALARIVKARHGAVLAVGGIERPRTVARWSADAGTVVCCPDVTDAERAAIVRASNRQRMDDRRI